MKAGILAFVVLVQLNIINVHGWFWSCNPGKEGDGCSLFCPCGGDLTCEAWYHKCRAPGKLGDSCHATKPCGSGLSCHPQGLYR
jgi:hypothetical protein